jgi:hypothetical protein
MHTGGWKKKLNERERPLGRLRHAWEGSSVY